MKCLDEAEMRPSRKAASKILWKDDERGGAFRSLTDRPMKFDRTPLEQQE